MFAKIVCVVSILLFAASLFFLMLGFYSLGYERGQIDYSNGIIQHDIIENAKE